MESEVFNIYLPSFLAALMLHILSDCLDSNCCQTLELHLVETPRMVCLSQTVGKCVAEAKDTKWEDG